LPESTLH